MGNDNQYPMIIEPPEAASVREEALDIKGGRARFTTWDDGKAGVLTIKWEAPCTGHTTMWFSELREAEHLLVRRMLSTVRQGHCITAEDYRNLERVPVEDLKDLKDWAPGSPIPMRCR
ncbi:MAG: hypothetical protein AB1725_12405 [Armatimonadota bacterium]